MTENCQNGPESTHTEGPTQDTSWRYMTLLILHMQTFVSFSLSLYEVKRVYIYMQMVIYAHVESELQKAPVTIKTKSTTMDVQHEC